MPKVKKLDKKIYELIAAGEVIERPSSIIKELAENSIDSGASAITAEIKRGGISYMRITDNGCGIDGEDVPTAFLRHATSKISTAEDLNGIITLGFRGEALASAAAVSKMEVLTKVKDCEYGTHYVIEGTEEKLCESCGCPDGTTMIVRDIFYNVPARLKFLKKDVSEGNDVARIIEKLALSHPEISFKLIRDNKSVLFTPGDSKLYSAIYSVFGKQFAASLIPVDYTMNGISITGYTVKPIFGLKNRRMQNFFVNGRYVQSVTCMLALEEAYKNSVMEGKFPACVLMMEISPEMLDVNVHPQKTEVRFTAERSVYEAVYFAVKNAVLSDSKPNDIVIPPHRENYLHNEFEDRRTYEQTGINISPKPPAETDIPRSAPAVDPQPVQRISAEDYRRMTGAVPKGSVVQPSLPPARQEISPAPVQVKAKVSAAVPRAENVLPERENEHVTVSSAPAENTAADETVPIEDLAPPPVPVTDFKYINEGSFETKKEPYPDETYADRAVPQNDEIPYFRLIGEAFKTYIIAETEDDIIFVDKHAAHERINFEKLRSGEEKLSCQMLLSPVDIRLEYSQYEALSDSLAKAEELGFMFEMREAPDVTVLGIPSILDICDAADIASELAENLGRCKNNPMPDALDDLLHSIACKASIRANDNNSPAELSAIVERLFRDETIRYCPHGRPVMFRLKKRELEKQFRRIV